MRMSETEWAVAIIIGILAFTALLIFGIGWAANLGDNTGQQVQVACANHPAAAVCESVSYDLKNRTCKSVADDASSTAGGYEQNFTGADWRRLYDGCMGIHENSSNG